MARTPKLRVHYAADRGFLQRLQQAVEKDGRQSEEWREAVCLHLIKLESLLLKADQARLE